MKRVDAERGGRFGRESDGRYVVKLEPVEWEWLSYPTWSVYRDGVHIGEVEKGNRTWERRTAGRMYVNSRGQTLAWYVGYGEDRPRHIDMSYDTRNAAIRQLVEWWIHEHREVEE